MIYVPFQGWVNPNATVSGQQRPLAGEQDVMMISGLGNAGEPQPASNGSSASPMFMLVVGVLLGLLLASVLAVNTVSKE